MFEMWEFLKQGGWPMVPLGICSLCAAAVIIERSFALRWAKVIHPHVLDIMDTFRGEESVESAIHGCRRCGGALAEIVEEILHSRHHERAQTVESMHATGRRETGILERGLTVLEIVAGISPLIGLLGTVLGMVTVFSAISEAGMGDPQVLSAGISKALITTVTGLCVAIPALAFHSFFSRRVESLGVEMQDISTAFIARVYSAGRGAKEDAGQNVYPLDTRGRGDV